MDIDLGQARRRAKELLRSARAGDPAALASMRTDRTPRLADVHRAIARELGFGSWSALVAHADELAVEREDAAARTGSVHVTGLWYVPGRPVRISVRHRGHRYDIDDMGAAVAIAARPAGWLGTAEQVVHAIGWNINRDGVVFVPAVEGRDIDALIERTAEASVAVLTALLELDE
jgi:hypothetical protein